ncbi:MAG: FKBP-type peptidyl-prolyl cis-trans isomerase [Bacteroidales bacterium]|nr:FKBP-type peptidyl-prolyl cis-trans isomerase [Candidatus Colimorpha onthohippi]
MDSASFAIGCDMYGAWSSQGLDFTIEAVAAGLLESAKGYKMSDEQKQSLLMRLEQEMANRRQAKIQENIDKGKAFIEENGKRTGVKSTESGIQYEVVKSGNGIRPSASDMVKVHYTGKLIDGTVFDSSVERGEPIQFPLTQVIPGWSEGVQLMDVGSVYKLYIPYHLGYGEQQVHVIPGGSTLIFEVELLEIVKEQEKSAQ